MYDNFHNKELGGTENPTKERKGGREERRKEGATANDFDINHACKFHMLGRNSSGPLLGHNAFLIVTSYSFPCLHSSHFFCLFLLEKMEAE